jgi:hypothetical protein
LFPRLRIHHQRLCFLRCQLPENILGIVITNDTAARGSNTDYKGKMHMTKLVSKLSPSQGTVRKRRKEKARSNHVSVLTFFRYHTPQGSVHVSSSFSVPLIVLSFRK